MNELRPSIGGTRQYGHPDAVACARYRDLLAGLADATEPTEADVMARAPRGPTTPLRHRLPRSASECPQFSDAEVGAIVLLRMDGHGVDSIAVELGIMEVDALKEFVRRLERMNGKTHRGRRREVGAETEAEIRRLRYGEKLTVPEISRRTGRSDSSIRYMLSHPRPE